MTRVEAFVLGFIKSGVALEWSYHFDMSIVVRRVVIHHSVYQYYRLLFCFVVGILHHLITLLVLAFRENHRFIQGGKGLDFLICLTRHLLYSILSSNLTSMKGSIDGLSLTYAISVPWTMRISEAKLNGGRCERLSFCMIFISTLTHFHSLYFKRPSFQ